MAASPAPARQYPRDAHTLVAGGETEALPVPVRGEPGIQYPGARQHHSGLTAAKPRTFHSRRVDDAGHSYQQQPEQEKGEQHADSGGGRALPEQADARCQADEGAEIDQYLACGHTLRYRLPYRDEIAFDQAQDSEGHQGRRKDRMTQACDAHRPILRVVFNFIGYSHALYATRYAFVLSRE